MQQWGRMKRNETKIFQRSLIKKDGSWQHQRWEGLDVLKGGRYKLFCPKQYLLNTLHHFALNQFKLNNIQNSVPQSASQISSAHQPHVTSSNYHSGQHRYRTLTLSDEKVLEDLFQTWVSETKSWRQVIKMRKQGRAAVLRREMRFEFRYVLLLVDF